MGLSLTSHLIKQVAVVVGRPMPVPKVDNPTPELVAEYLDKYCKEVEALFHRYACIVCILYTYDDVVW